MTYWMVYVEHSAGSMPDTAHTVKDTDDRLAWAADIVDLLSGRDDGSAGRYPMVTSDELQDFISHDDSHSQIVSGTRGMGKSASLFFKAANLSKNKRFVLVLPTYPYVFRLRALSIVVPANRVSTFGGHQAWTPIWLLVLGTLLGYTILKDRLGIPATKTSEWLDKFGVSAGSLEAKFFKLAFAWALSPQQEKISSLISWLIDRNIPIKTLNHWYRTHVEPTLGLPDQSKCFAIFVDQIDEAIAGERSLLRQSVKDEVRGEAGMAQIQNMRLLSEQLWIAAQTGFADAAYHLRTGTTHAIRIYGSMRTEAVRQFALNAQQTESKVAAMILPLKYEDRDLKAIFDNNVLLTGPTGLACPTEKVDLAKRFFGRSVMRNRAVWGEEERMRDYLIRHTFESPRDIVIIGKAIRRKVPAAERASDTNRVMNEVKTAAKFVLREHLDNVYPPWNQEWERAFPLIHANILTQDEVRKIEDLFARMTSGRFPALFSELYDRQLVGYPNVKDTRNPTLKFHSADDQPGAFPAIFDYCAIHPALAAAILETVPTAKGQKAFYRGHFIVGKDYEVPQELEETIVTLRPVSPQDTGAEVVIGSGTVINEHEESKACGLMLIMAILCAIKRTGKSKVSPDEIVDEALWLEASNYLERRYYGQHHDMKTGEYLTHQLAYTTASSQKYSVRMCKEILATLNLSLGHDGSGGNGLFWLQVHRDNAVQIITSGQIAIRLRNE